ncbi:MAG: ArnT family glycosyltransferase [Anaerolineae bacterium]
MSAQNIPKSWPARAYPLACSIILAAGLLLRLMPITLHRFHPDEALYAYWGLQIATGRDPMLETYPVDKPPAFPYLLALVFRLLGPSELAARLPSLIASTVSLVLIARIARQAYGREAALLALGLLALSPFDISFAVTAFTDPLMVMWVLAGLSAVLAGRPLLAGICAGLSFATKQQGIFFLPLLALAGIWRERFLPRRGAAVDSQNIRRLWGAWWARGLAGFAAAFAPVLIWDLVRMRRPEYFAQSLISYGGLTFAPWQEWEERAASWGGWLARFWGAPALNALAALALVALLWDDLRGRRKTGGTAEAAFDLLIAGFGLLFLLGHWLVRFNTWDRYVLGLVPLTALLLGRAFTRLLRRWKPNAGLSVTLGTLTLLTLLLIAPVRTAARGAYPAGGDHGTYWGIDRVAQYMRAHVPANAVIYHHWLGWHYLYYLYDAPYAFQWYTSPEEVVKRVREWSDVPHWIVFPMSHEWEPIARALQAAGLSLQERFHTARADGQVTFRVYELHAGTATAGQPAH